MALELTQLERPPGALAVLMGEAGAGKTSYLLNFKPESTAIWPVVGEEGVNVLAGTGIRSLPMFVDWDRSIEVAKELAKGPEHHGLRVVGLDSVTALSRLIERKVIDDHPGAATLAIPNQSFGYGYDCVSMLINELLGYVQGMVNRGMIVVLLAHTHIKTKQCADQEDHPYVTIRALSRVREAIVEKMDVGAILRVRVMKTGGGNGKAQSQMATIIDTDDRELVAHKVTWAETKCRYDPQHLLDYPIALKGRRDNVLALLCLGEIQRAIGGSR